MANVPNGPAALVTERTSTLNLALAELCDRAPFADAVDDDAVDRLAAELNLATVVGQYLDPADQVADALLGSEPLTTIELGQILSLAGQHIRLAANMSLAALGSPDRIFRSTGWGSPR